jgi:hypothetical protein
MCRYPYQRRRRLRSYAMAMSYYNNERGTDKFIDLSFVNITYFSAVMRPQNHETLVKKDVSIAKFANVNVDSVRYFQTTDFTHLHRMSNLIDYIMSVYRNLGKDTRLMTLPQDGTPLHTSMIEYFTRFRDDILQQAKQTCFDELTVFHLLSYMGKKGYENGIEMMLAEERTAAGKKGYENRLGMMSAEERTATGKKGYENGLGGMSKRMLAAGITWEEKYAEFKRCLEMPERVTPLHTWQKHQLGNTRVSLNAKIREELAENKGSTIWSEGRVKLVNCVEQKNRAKIGNTWEEKYDEFESYDGMPERGTPLYNWQQNQLSNTHDSCLNAKIQKELAENKGSTILSERRVKLANCVEQKRRE